ncbi:MAG: hypothetical protein WBC44_16405 [Planctomycetaceae bacterium]
MIQFRDNLAINTTQADAAFGLVAAADINHRARHCGESMFPRCSGKRRRMPKWSYTCSTVPVRPVVEGGGCVGKPTGSTTTPLPRPVTTGGPAATFWATLVLQRALSS